MYFPLFPYSTAKLLSVAATWTPHTATVREQKKHSVRIHYTDSQRVSPVHQSAVTFPCLPRGVAGAMTTVTEAYSRVVLAQGFLADGQGVVQKMGGLFVFVLISAG